MARFHCDLVGPPHGRQNLKKIKEKINCTFVACLLCNLLLLKDLEPLDTFFFFFLCLFLNGKLYFLFSWEYKHFSRCMIRMYCVSEKYGSCFPFHPSFYVNHISERVIIRCELFHITKFANGVESLSFEAIPAFDIVFTALPPSHLCGRARDPFLIYT